MGTKVDLADAYPRTNISFHQLRNIRSRSKLHMVEASLKETALVNPDL